MFCVLTKILWKEHINECLSQYVEVSEEDIFEINQHQNLSSNDEDIGEKKLPGRKPLVGGLSTDTFLTLSHTLRCYAEFIAHLVNQKKCRYVLPGFSNNDRIEKYFCFMRYLAGMHLALDITSFC